VIATQAVADWLNAHDFGIKLHWRPGPEQLEFDVNNTSATVTRTGGQGLLAEGTEDDYTLLLLVRSGRTRLGQLEQAADAIDRALLAIGSEMIWGTYVQFVDRLGAPPLPDYESPERVLMGAQYQVREGRENG
jgi:hypothetical protein